MFYYSNIQKSEYKFAILTPQLLSKELSKHYIDPYDLPKDDFCAFELYKNPTKNKTPMSEMRQFFEEELVPKLNKKNIQYIIIADGDYFKAITKLAKSDAYAGYIVDSPYGDWKILYVPNFQRLFFDPEKTSQKIQQGMAALVDHYNDTYTDPGQDILKFCAYPQTVPEIREWLLRLIKENKPLAADIETFSLKHYDAGIATISFAWNSNEGIAFPVDLLPNQADREEVREMLRDFFEHFNNRLLWHNISFDIYVLVYQLYMDHILDTEGLLKGLDILLKDWDDTKIIAYLATNSCAGNQLSLKLQSQEFTGNYAIEIEDISAHELSDILQYNLIDTCATWFVYNKHWDTLVADQQLEVYNTIFKPSIKDIIQMQLTGMPIDINRVAEVKAILSSIFEEAVQNMLKLPFLSSFVQEMKLEEVKKRNEAYKVKVIDIDEAKFEFNPNSAQQIQKILHNTLQLPIISKTKSGAPSTGADTLGKLKNMVSNEETMQFLDALISYKAVDKILNSFIPAFESAVQAGDGYHYLFGNFNLGGTVSGRLSSSKPNLQNLPSNVQMLISTGLVDKFPILKEFVYNSNKLALGKLIKSCIKPPEGWMLIGIDFNALEARIDALTTKDPAKLGVYIDGFDSHSFNSFGYWPDKMKDIRMVSPEENKKTYCVIIDDVEHYLLGDDKVEDSLGNITSVDILFNQQQQQ